ncbi:hypothetical protein OH828_05670 [Streptomyces anulatus]|nr:hypothetical protein [Streptomyces sp. WAC00303]UPT45796.1 hypothetical protein MWG59_33050 [Streptomyces sp. WAC00303]
MPAYVIVNVDVLDEEAGLVYASVARVGAVARVIPVAATTFSRGRRTR